MGIRPVVVWMPIYTSDTSDEEEEEMARSWGKLRRRFREAGDVRLGDVVKSPARE
jgi:hypothetical protein